MYTRIRLMSGDKGGKKLAFIMARRKKEPQNVHRKNIMKAAEQLFMTKGIEIGLPQSHWL